MGQIIHEGFTDVMEDWPLHRHLWTGWLPEDDAEAARVINLARYFQANNDELQVRYPSTQADPERWINVAPLANREQILADTHASLGHCGRDKLFTTIKEFWWWPGLQ